MSKSIKPCIIHDGTFSSVDFNKPMERNSLLLFLRDLKKSADLYQFVGPDPSYGSLSDFNRLVRSVKSKRDLNKITKTEKDILFEVVAAGDYSDWLYGEKRSLIGMLKQADSRVVIENRSGYRPGK